MRFRRYRARHLLIKRRKRGPAALGTATAVWIGTTQAAEAAVHRVQPGETLSRIAARYGVTTAELARINHISDPNVIYAGAVLQVPDGSGRPAARTYRVRRGDTLSEIAARFDTSVQALARRNHISDPDVVVAGSELRVPAVTKASAGGSAPEAPAPGSRALVGRLLEAAAGRHGLDAAILKALAWQESGWQQDVVSPTGAVGIMQVVPGTARYVTEVLGAGSLDLHTAADNVEIGAVYLRHLLDAMGSEERAIAAYYTGPGAVGKHLDRRQRHYVTNVLSLAKRF